MTSTTFIQNSANSALTSCLLSILAKQSKHSMRDPYSTLVRLEKVYVRTYISTPSCPFMKIMQFWQITSQMRYYCGDIEVAIKVASCITFSSELIK